MRLNNISGTAGIDGTLHNSKCTSTETTLYCNSSKQHKCHYHCLSLYTKPVLSSLLGPFGIPQVTLTEDVFGVLKPSLT